jgi:RNA polymerase sigma factor (TIGR02999 family)
MGDVTRIFELLPGDPTDAAQLMPLLYDELRKLAAQKLAGEPAGQTLQPTALVHEAWLRMTTGQPQKWQNRAHFFAAAAEAMRRILIENARRKGRLKRGGEQERVELDEINIVAAMPDEELLAVNEALDELSSVNARAAELVKLCFFVGLTQEQAAKEMGISVSTAERTWAYARAWLYRQIERQRGNDPG